MASTYGKLCNLNQLVAYYIKGEGGMRSATHDPKMKGLGQVPLSRPPIDPPRPLIPPPLPFFFNTFPCVC